MKRVHLPAGLKASWQGVAGAVCVAGGVEWLAGPGWCAIAAGAFLLLGALLSGSRA